MRGVGLGIGGGGDGAVSWERQIDSDKKSWVDKMK